MRARPDSFAVAAKHIAWCIRRGMRLADVQDALDCAGWHSPVFRCWHDAIWAVATANDRLSLMLADRGAQAHHGTITVSVPRRRREEDG
jgi:hypothetical protein